MIDIFDATLPHGITLNCRASGRPGAPVLLFLHGFPEAAFVWDALLEHFGDRFRCVAPNLRGYAPSSAPAEAEQYRVKHLMADLDALISQLGGGPLAALVAHDWGGAIAWSLAAQRPELMQRLVIINSPHPATFLRELKYNPEQRAASSYMNFLCRPDAEKRLAENDYARLWAMFENMGATDRSHPGGGWLTPEVRDQYHAVWGAGLGGGCNYYRASPLRPPTEQDDSLMKIEFPAEFVTVRVPTLVIWGLEDKALPKSLIDGLDAFVPDLRLLRVPGATHWIIHERPEWVADEIGKFLAA
ncbi:MAG: alpha/beta hydrolase [Pseudomonadota bacterium]|nr:alpha/beta hydrolase [Pseudomonadota bacterium]